MDKQSNKNIGITYFSEALTFMSRMGIALILAAVVILNKKNSCF